MKTKKYIQIDDAEVFASEDELVVCGTPLEDDERHNCDEMGCTSVSHVLYRTNAEYTQDYTDLVQSCYIELKELQSANKELLEELETVLGID